MMQTWSMLMMAYCGLCGKLVVFYKIMFSHCYCAGAGMMQCVTTVHNFIFLNVTFTPTCICPNSWYLMLIGILGSLRMFQIYFYIHLSAYEIACVVLLGSFWILPLDFCLHLIAYEGVFRDLLRCCYFLIQVRKLYESHLLPWMR